MPEVEFGSNGNSASLKKTRTADSKKPITAGLIPCKIDFTAIEELNCVREPGTNERRTEEGRVAPSVAIKEPIKEARGLLSQALAPTKVAALTATGPGVICEIVAI